MLYYVTLITRRWVGAEASHFHCKTIIAYFRALEGCVTAEYSPFMPKLPLTEALDQSPNPPKKAPVTIVFALCEDARGVS